MIDDRRHRIEIEMDVAADEIDARLPAALVRHVQHVDFGLQLEQLAGEMLHGAGAGRRVLQLARPRLRQCDEFLDRSDRHRRMHHQQVGADGGKRYRGKIFLCVVWQLADQRRQDGDRRDVRHHDGVTVGCGPRQEFRRKLAAGAAAVVDDDLLAERFTEFLRDDAADDVGAAAGRKADHHADRFGGVTLGERGAARGAQQTQREQEM